MSALSRLKNRQSPGPDQLPAEIWKYAPREVHKALLAHFNKAFPNAESPRSWKVADIVMIIKKKKTPRSPRATAQSRSLAPYIKYIRLFASRTPQGGDR